MRHDFAAGFLSLVRCMRDGGDLQLADGPAGLSGGANIEARCERCGESYPVRDGILDLLGDSEPTDDRSRLEMHARDQDARNNHPYGLPPWHPPWRDALEVAPTLRRLGSVRERTVLELGCGTGLYTRLLVQRGARVLAVDFSLDSLRINRAHLPSGSAAAFVRADVSRLRLKPGAFDLALSTLYSNLPTVGLRKSTSLAVREALRHGGRFVVSAHHQDLKRRYARIEPAGVYSEDFPVFYQCFTRAELRRELSVFGEVRVDAIAIFWPYLSRIERLRSPLSRLGESLPLLRDLGLLLVANATVANPREGTVPGGGHAVPSR